MRFAEIRLARKYGSKLGSESVGYYLEVGGKVKAVRSKTTKQATKQPNKQRSSPKGKEGDTNTGTLGERPVPDTKEEGQAKATYQS